MLDSTSLGWSGALDMNTYIQSNTRSTKMPCKTACGDNPPQHRIQLQPHRAEEFWQAYIYSKTQLDRPTQETNKTDQPPLTTITLSVDATFDNDVGRYAVGYIIHDSEGRTIRAGCSPILVTGSALGAEMSVIQLGLEYYAQ